MRFCGFRLEIKRQLPRITPEGVLDELRKLEEVVEKMGRQVEATRKKVYRDGDGLVPEVAIENPPSVVHQPLFMRTGDPANS